MIHVYSHDLYEIIYESAILGQSGIVHGMLDTILCSLTG